MELKTKLDKPYTDKQRLDFIVENNHQKGYEIRETDEALEAWGMDKNDEIEAQKNAVRAVREQYFINYVDWYQSKPLLWEEMTDEEKQDIADYRHYLMDYTKQENWWVFNPLDFDTWKESRETVEEN